MSEGWKVVAAEVGKRLLQIMVVVMAEEVVRRGFSTAFNDNNDIHYEKPKNKKATVGNKE